jgi:ubiquitin-like-conjugating enzyme ATG10
MYDAVVAMFTRDQFELACQTFAIRHPRWSWVPGHRAGYGFLSRTCYHTHKIPVDLDVSISDLDEMGIEEDDSATAQDFLSPSFCVNEYIIYSASFNVPAFYFTIHDSSG